MKHRRWLVLTGIVVTLSCSFTWLLYVRHFSISLPYRDGFAEGKISEWKAYDGTWNIANGVLRNDSDARGAKFITGSPQWTDYSLDVDLQIGDARGQAGVIVRLTNEELGADAYNGYFIGISRLDNRLFLDRNDFGWTEYDSAPVPNGVRLNYWYHLKVIAVGCTIAGQLSNPSSPATPYTLVSMIETSATCASRGAIGLRSMKTGGAWRNVHVERAEQSDLQSVIGSHLSQRTMVPRSLREILNISSVDTHEISSRLISSQLPPSVPMRDLRLASVLGTDHRAVQGSVTLVKPYLVVQDPTGGVRVDPAGPAPAVKIGDVVAAQGLVQPRGFSAVLSNAYITILSTSIPEPPLSVTAFQAATGAFDKRFVELQARLEQRNIDSYGLSVFFSTDFGQRFYVRPQVSTTFAGIRRESLVRLRGICTTDAIDTNNRVPFTVLLREPDDVIVLSGPPWWSTGNLIAIAIGLLCLALLLYLLRLRAERWKLRAISGERQRLAHELHDTLAQSFAGIGFHLSAVRKQLPAQLSALKAQIDVANDLVRQGHLEARQSIATLRPNVFDSIAILPSLEQAAQKIVRGSGIELDLSESGAVRDIPLKVKDTLYRVALEAIANAARHAGPSRISVALLYHKRSLQLVIEDDGKGFQLDQVTSDSFGLKGIAERMRSIDGSFGVSSIPSHGTTVCVDAPIPSQHHLTRLLAFVSRKQQIP